jgi:hypothetical protein
MIWSTLRCSLVVKRVSSQSERDGKEASLNTSIRINLHLRHTTLSSTTSDRLTHGSMVSARVTATFISGRVLICSGRLVRAAFSQHKKDTMRQILTHLTLTTIKKARVRRVKSCHQSKSLLTSAVVTTHL